MTKQPDDQPNAAEIAKATKEGVLDKVRESANLQDDSSVQGEDPKGETYLGQHEIMQLAHYVDYDLNTLKAALDVNSDSAIPDSKVAGLLGLERGGKNRTEFVKAYMERLRIANPKLKSVYDVTSAGPAYTNDTHQVSDI